MVKVAPMAALAFISMLLLSIGVVSTISINCSERIIFNAGPAAT